MKTITCDICGFKSEFDMIKVRVRDGEHPHCGSTMHKRIDVCKDCIQAVPDLESSAEFEDLIRK